MIKTKYLIAAALLVFVPLLGRIWWVQEDNKHHGYGTYICKGTTQFFEVDQYYRVHKSQIEELELIKVFIQKKQGKPEVAIHSDVYNFVDNLPFFSQAGGSVYSQRTSVLSNKHNSKMNVAGSAYANYYFDEQYSRLHYVYELEVRPINQPRDLIESIKYEFKGRCEKTS